MNLLTLQLEKPETTDLMAQHGNNGPLYWVLPWPGPLLMGQPMYLTKMSFLPYGGLSAPTVAYVWHAIVLGKGFTTVLAGRKLVA